MQLEIEGVLRPVERATIEEVEEEILPYVEEKFRFSLSPKVVKQDTARTALFKTWVWWRKDQRILGHALCAMYDGRVLMIEPQLDKIFYPPRNWNLWNLEG